MRAMDVTATLIAAMGRSYNQRGCCRSAPMRAMGVTANIDRGHDARGRTTSSLPIIRCSARCVDTGTGASWWSIPCTRVAAMGFAKSIPLLLAVLLAACAQRPVRDSSGNEAHQAIDYTKYVQGTVPWFHFTSLYSWDSNQPGYVVVWTSPVQAYRLALVGPCLGLQSAPGVIGLTSQGGEVSSTRDAVIAGGDRCKIMRIERLDARAIRAARKGSSKEPGG